MLPQPSWWELIDGVYTNTSEIPWEMGIVDAGTESAPNTFYMANNHPDDTEAEVDEDAPHMYNCQFTVVDATGQPKGPVVTGEDKEGINIGDGTPWLHIKHSDEADDEANWNEVGFKNEAQITAYIGHDTTAEIIVGEGAVDNAISGDYNAPFDFGDATNLNFFAFDNKLVVPQEAPSGPMEFLLRITYDYVGLGDQ